MSWEHDCHLSLLCISLFLHISTCKHVFDLCQAGLSMSGRSKSSMSALSAIFLRFQFWSVPSNWGPNLGVTSKIVQMMGCSWLGGYQCEYPEKQQEKPLQERHLPSLVTHCPVNHHLSPYQSFFCYSHEEPDIAPWRQTGLSCIDFKWYKMSMFRHLDSST